MKFPAYSLIGSIVLAVSLPAAEPSKATPPASKPRPSAGLTQSILGRNEPKDPEWEAYVELRARMRVLASERNKVVAAAAPADRAKVGREWDRKHQAELDLFEQKAAIIAKRSASPNQPATTSPKEQSGKSATEVKHRNPLPPDVTGRVKGELKNKSLPNLPPAPGR